MKLFGSMKVENNHLTIGGINTSSLAAKYGTPLYIMDEELIRSNCRDYYNEFQCEARGNRVAYAGKAFLTLDMCRLVMEENLYLDVVSGGELFTAKKAGFPLERIYFHGNNKTIDEINLGVSYGVGRFVVDNLYEMEQVDRVARENNKVQKIYLRITPGIEAHTHEYIKTGQIDSKFGFAPVGNIIMDAVRMAIDLQNVELCGVHCHIGSQIFDIQPYEDAAEIMLNLIYKIQQETGYVVPELDLGGGFGIFYTDGDEPRETSEYCRAILNKVDKVCEELNINKPIITIEPGRSIVGNAGTTIYTVGSIKEIPGIRKYVSVDGGMTDNIRPSLYRAEYECLVANNVISDYRERVAIAGKCCESGDILLNSIEMQKVNSGDILAILSTGAYGYSMSNNYNKTPRAAVVMVQNGSEKLICKRETYEDLIRNEI